MRAAWWGWRVVRLMVGAWIVACGPPRPAPTAQPTATRPAYPPGWGRPSPRAPVEKPGAPVEKPGAHGVRRFWPARPLDALPGLPPDVAPLRRWPLGVTDHPDGEPRFDIAGALGAPGTTWRDLCAMGAHRRVLPSRQHQLAYLAGWCAIAGGDPDAALAALVPLFSAPEHALASAARRDVAFLLVDDAHRDDAERLIVRHRIYDLATLDLAAAAAVDAEDLPLARALSSRVVDATRSSDPARCHRRARAVLLVDDPLRLLADLDRLVPGEDAPCAELRESLRCHLDETRCRGYLAVRGADASQLLLIDALASWPSRDDDRSAKRTGWGLVFHRAKAVGAVPGAAHVQTLALAGLVMTAYCDELEPTALAAFVREIRALPGLSAAHAQILDAIEQTPDALCLPAPGRPRAATPVR